MKVDGFGPRLCIGALRKFTGLDHGEVMELGGNSWPTMKESEPTIEENCTEQKYFYRRPSSCAGAIDVAMPAADW